MLDMLCPVHALYMQLSSVNEMVFTPCTVVISSCSHGNNVVDTAELARESEDVKENVKRKFLVQMPEDFYQFWEFCESQNPSIPQGTLYVHCICPLSLSN